MGQYNKGILGSFAGKIGTVIGSTWNGIMYMKSLPAIKKSRSFSQPQLEQQAKFGLMIKFVRSLYDLFILTFKNADNGMTGANSAMRYNLNNAVQGAYPAYSINYASVLISRGVLPGAEAAVTDPSSVSMAGLLTFRWNDNTGKGRAKATDKAILLAYCDADKAGAYAVTTDTRGSGTATLNVQAYAGKTVHTYLAFISDDGKYVSDSVYIGMQVVF
ncbi:MAG: DUF6266 family protein [Chitinophagaceae bacterium]